MTVDVMQVILDTSPSHFLVCNTEKLERPGDDINKVWYTIHYSLLFFLVPSKFVPPSIGSITPSYAATHTDGARKVYNQVCNQPLYYHYFITELYNAYLQFKNDTKAQVSIGDNCFKVDQKSLETTSCFLKQLLDSDDRQYSELGGLLCNPSMRYEVSTTSLCARHLDRFFFPDGSCGMCLHQLNIRDTQKVDICVVPFPQHGWPTAPCLVCDMKVCDFDAADVATKGYSINVLEKDMLPRVQLGLAFTCQSASLQVHLTGQRRLHSSTVVKSCLYDKTLLCTLYVGVHSLLKHPINRKEPFNIATPFRSVSLHNISVSSNSRVFLDKTEQKVYKFYDGDCCNPNIELINELGDGDQPYLPDVALHTVTSDKRVQYLSYRYIPSTSIPSIQHFASIIQILHKVHNKGMVHCDIREANLIFGCDGKGWIIDFDLVREEGENYPFEYNHTGIPERHEYARKTLPAFKEHDRFSLSMIMYHAGMPQYIIEKVKNMSIDLADINFDFM